MLGSPTIAAKGIRAHFFIIFYFVVPLAISLVFGLRGQMANVWLSVLLFVVHVVPAWWYDGIASWAFYRLLARWRPPTILIVVLGSVAATGFVLAHYRLVYFVTGDLFGGFNDPARLPPPAFTVEFFEYLFRQHAVGVFLWTAANLVFDRFLGVPRYRYDGGARESGRPASLPEGSGDPEPPLFVRRLPANLGTRVLAVEAEEHYLKVHTDLGSSLILYRFSDALADLAGMRGLRVHRSYWISIDAIKFVRVRNRSYEIELVNGLRVPVSLTYKGAVESAGLAAAATAD